MKKNDYVLLRFVMSMQRGDQLYVDLNAPCKKENRGDGDVEKKPKEISNIKRTEKKEGEIEENRGE